jgi:hypothetical protein
VFLLNVLIKCSDVSEEHIASFFKVSGFFQVGVEVKRSKKYVSCIGRLRAGIAKNVEVSDLFTL